MKIISSQQSKDLDAATIAREPISSLNLMERAGRNITESLVSDFPNNSSFAILCGNGNNGGDGLVIARLLKLKGYQVVVFTDLSEERKSTENIENLKKLKEDDIPISGFHSLKEIKNCVWIDALFGSGLSRPISGQWADIIKTVNGYQAYKIAIDIPSGLMSNSIPSKDEIIFEADKTYTIGQPKLTFFLPESGSFVGDFSIIDIDLDKEFLKSIKTPFYYSSLREMRNIYKPRTRFTHKGTFGHALLIAGSYGKMGAALMATKAALKAGAGLVTSYVPGCGYEMTQISIPEAMCITDSDAKSITHLPDISGFDSIGVGCGLGNDIKTKNAFYDWLKNTNFTDKALVIDADGLNYLSQNKSFLNHLPKHTILTPHPKEFERLTHKPNHSLHRLEIAQKFAQDYEVILVLKDAYTCVVAPNGQVYFNSTGNAGLSTGGSGDTLTGIITGLLAQSYHPLDAARLAVWLHGESADIGVQFESLESFTATDIERYLGRAFKNIGFN